MKKICLIISLFCAFIYLGSCTNDEGGSDLDVVTPDDTITAVTNSNY